MPRVCADGRQETLPADPEFSIIVGGGDGVGGLLVIVKMVAPAVAGDSFREIHLERPAGNVERVDSIVGEFASSVEPMPMPIVGNEVVL